MQKKYLISLLFVTVGLLIVIVCAIGYVNYEKPKEKNDNAYVYVDGQLSFNFIDGNQIDTNEQEKIYQFSVTNTSYDSFYYNISLEHVSVSNAQFELLSNREGFQTLQKKYPNEDQVLLNTIKINGGETHHYSFRLINDDLEHVVGTIKTGLEKEMANFSNVILKSNVVNTSPKTGVSFEVATEDEGLIESTDDYGTSYYFRGNVQNNYVWFANMLWRIVKINGDGSVKLILHDLASNNTQFYSLVDNYDFEFPDASIYKSLQSFYDSYLKPYDELISNFKFCTDSTYDEKGFSSLTRIYTNHSPLFQCMGHTDTTKIGLLTADEVSFAGATEGSQNKDFYLYHDGIKASWWTMSPAGNQNGVYSFIEVSQNGQMNRGTIGTLFRGSRPVIQLVKRVSVTGSGTYGDPYVVNNV